MQELARQVESRAERIAEASLEGMYDDPFWFARFGEEQARRFGSEDARQHVRSLVQAIENREPGVMGRYARGLKAVLVPRGLCSRHIMHQFHGLREALRREGLDGEPETQAALHAAEAALIWPEGPARDVQLADMELALHALSHLPREETEANRKRLLDELLLHISYLADALGAKRPELFLEHVRWYAGFWPLRGLRCTFSALLAALELAMAQEPSIAGEPRALLASGRAALEAARS